MDFQQIFLFSACGFQDTGQVVRRRKRILNKKVQVCRAKQRAGDLVVPLKNAVGRAANYTGCHVTTCWRAEAVSHAPRRKRSDCFMVDSFDRDVVRRTVHELIEKGKGVPTAKKILQAVREKIDFPGKLTFLRQLLKEIGFEWKKCGSNRTLLMERTDVVVARVNFLRQIKKYRDDGRPIIYTDETYVHTTHSMKKCWQSDDVSVKIPFSKGERLIVVHAGSKEGFIKGACLLFKAGSSSGDYHDEMNSANFNKWLTERLIPNLPANSVLVVDNAAYHNVQHDKCPTATTRKADIQSWMERHDPAYKPTMLKAELLEICKRNKPPPCYILDATLKQHGHDCLRLPQYYAELNAIELIWANIKGKIAGTNVTYKYKDVLKVTQDAIDSVTGDEWKACCRHVWDMEEKFRKSHISVEEAMESFIIEVTDEEGTDTATDDSETESASDATDYSDTDTGFEIV